MWTKTANDLFLLFFIIIIIIIIIKINKENLHYQKYLQLY